jgi:hypothetical protein
LIKKTLGLAVGIALASSVVVTAPTPIGAPFAATAASPGTATPTADSDVALTPATFADPPASARPGTRWWWDSIVLDTGFSLTDALAEVDAMADAGLGRFEIAWAAGNYGTPSQQDALAAVAERALARGMQLDMTLGAGWPWATPTTTGDLGQQELMYGRKDLVGPYDFSGEVPAPVDEVTSKGKLVAVTAARVVDRGTPTGAPDVAPVVSTVVDPESLVDLTSHVSGTSLNWEVPEGNWILFAFWQRPDDGCGLAGTSGGNCVALTGRESVDEGLKYVDANQMGAAEPAVREVGHSFFEDSLEWNADELFWSDDFSAEFQTRRGYDPAKYLPLMFVATVTDFPVPERQPTPDFELPEGEGARYRHDYYQTLTDLYLDNHIKVVADWATKYGMQYRTQPAFGMSFEVIRSSRESAAAGALVDSETLNAGDTPFLVSQDGLEPGYDDPDNPKWRFALDQYRQVASGSHQGGSLEVSSELGAWFGLELATSLRDYKRMMDKQWSAGMSRPLLHGMTHSPAGTPWPGAAHFRGLVGESLNHRTWPQWTNLAQLSDYWGRGALLLQQGAPRTDVAVLRDSFVTAVTVATPQYFFDGLALEKAGYTIGYVDPQGVAEAPVGVKGDLFPQGPSYDVLVVDQSQFYVGPGRLPATAAEAIDRASAKGLKVVFVGTPPSQGLSGLAPAAEDARVAKAISSTLARSTTVRVDTQGAVAAAVARLGAKPAAAWSAPSQVYSQARETSDATYYLLWNASSQPQELTGSFVASGAPTNLNLWSGEFERLAAYRQASGRVEVPISLSPHETMALKFAKSTPGEVSVVESTADGVVRVASNTIEVRDAAGGPQTVRLSNGKTRTAQLPAVTSTPITVGGLASGGLWGLQVETYGPEGNRQLPSIPLLDLADWRTIPGLTGESGIGTYSATVNVPQTWVGASRGTLLDLGAFEGTVQAYVNGTLVTPDIDPQEPLDVTALLKPGTNTLKVVLATTPFNKAVTVSPVTALTRPLWAASVAHGTQAYGLLDDVRLLPYARGNVSTGP